VIERPGSTLAPTVHRSMVERSLRDTHGRLVRARQELAVLDEQLAVVTEEADEARLRSLVAETPLATHEYAEVRRHADAMTHARRQMAHDLDELERRQDELLTRVGTERP
jgi:hypothetical protein